MNIYNLFPTVRRWQGYPDEIQVATCPQDFLSIGSLEEKLLAVVERIDHRLNHIRQDIAYHPWIWLRHPLYDWIMPDWPCDCDC